VPIIDKLRDKLKFDLKSLALLDELEEILRRDKQRIHDLEIASDLADAVIKAYDKIDWRG
tara:strand:- start:132 stop:311 length:180 start_codon:yes stop_codon:yes gene_type:complete